MRVGTGDAVTRAVISDEKERLGVMSSDGVTLSENVVDGRIDGVFVRGGVKVAVTVTSSVTVRLRVSVDRVRVGVRVGGGVGERVSVAVRG